MEADLRSKEWGHLLQILYSLRVAQIDRVTLRVSKLKETLARIISTGEKEVANEASIVLQMLFGDEKNKREAPQADEMDNMIDVTTLLSDVDKYEPPHGEEGREKQGQSRPCHINIPISSWAIKYHPKECLLYVTGDNALFILHSSSLVTSPSEDYRVHFRQPRLLFEMCSSIFHIAQNLAEKDQPITYISILDHIWQDSRSDDVLVVEEDLIVNYLAIHRELNALDALHEYAANVNIFGMNDFISTLASRHKIWTKKNNDKDYLYGLQTEMELARFRSEQLWDDEKLEEMVREGLFPCVSSNEYPQGELVTDLTSEDLR